MTLQQHLTLSIATNAAKQKQIHWLFAMLKRQFPREEKTICLKEISKHGTLKKSVSICQILPMLISKTVSILTDGDCEFLAHPYQSYSEKQFYLLKNYIFNNFSEMKKYSF